MLKFINNVGEYFSANYFDEDFPAKVFTRCGYSAEDQRRFNQQLVPLKDRFFRFKQLLIEERLRTRDRIVETHHFHTHLLNALGYDGKHTHYDRLFHLSEQEVIPVRHILYRAEQPQLMIMEMQALIREDDSEPDGLFEQRYHAEEEIVSSGPQKYHRSQWEGVFSVPEGVKISPVIIHKAVSEIFLLEPHERPHFILLLAGNIVFLLEQEKWFRGSYLSFDLEELFTAATASPRANYSALFYFLTSREALVPDSNLVLLDQLDEDSHKSAYEVTKDLKEGVIHAVEALANEGLYYMKEVLGEDFDETDDQFEQEIKDDCLHIIYRLLFVFYAESREDLDILPGGDAYYQRGYSLEMLRDLEQVPLYAESSRHGYFFHESLQKLFGLLSAGYREKENGHNRSFRVRHIDSPVFDDRKLHHLRRVKFRNFVWQEIICQLSLSRTQRNRSRGRISYANLGINQLGSVYESLLAFRGFFAEQDYIEVHKAGKPDEGSLLVPRSRRDEFSEKEIRKDAAGETVVLKKGSFVYRLSGRDRQKSASYYTPEVLTQTTVKYTLKSILDRLERGEMKANELLDLRLLEPAMGAAAFHNEMINQLAEAYLSYRQRELRDSGRSLWKVEPDKYREEVQKVKAYIATNNVYGVDINPTAIELGKLSLWLNVIHKDMETPFFSNRICAGNAVVGAWLKVYPAASLAAQTDSAGRPLAKQGEKAWWAEAPRLLEFKPQQAYEKIRHGRKADEIYHFLLPDKNMLPSAGIKALKDEDERFVKRASAWKKEWTRPLLNSELEKLRAISQKIDELLLAYYRFQRSLQLQTRTRQQIFGATQSSEQSKLSLRSYDEKERLADQRNRHSAPYFKIKMVMDYWCSFWFWDLRRVDLLPDRNQYWQDIAQILEVDTNKAVEGILHARGQQQLFPTDQQLSMPLDSPAEGAGVVSFTDVVVEYANRQDLFDNNQRLQYVSELAKQYAFFHPQLEFLEVFWERGGFDLIAGNPPWLKLQFNEQSVVSEKFPEVLIRDMTAPKVRQLLGHFLQDAGLKEIFLTELLATECQGGFMNAPQNYPLLVGQQTNLYKCVLENGFNLLGKQGYMGLLHPEGVYDDPNGQLLRKEMYGRLRYHFQFRNEFSLFAETNDHGRMVFGIHVYAGLSSIVDFLSINNLFHPSTVEGCFLHDGHGICEGQKIFEKSSGKYIWNTHPHRDRIVRFREYELRILAKAFENSDTWESAKLVSVHSQQLMKVLETMSKCAGRVENVVSKTTVAWDEANTVKAGIIRQETSYPNTNDFELIYSGPHFFVGNPFYKTPREICNQNSHYDLIDLTQIPEDFVPRTNYKPAEPLEVFCGRIPGLQQIGTDDSGKPVHDRWIDYYKACGSRMVSIAGERTLQFCIIPPGVSHIDAVSTTIFREENLLIEFVGICSSLVMDFFVKSAGKGDVRREMISSFPLGIASKYASPILIRTLLLNCLTKPYAPLWERHWQAGWQQDSWSRQDARLKPFQSLQQTWTWDIPLRNAFERRQALVEIDVLSAMALGISLEELILIYEVQFPVLQQYEGDTWYDSRGNIIFTNSKGLVGLGVESKVWKTLRDLPAGQTYVHTIDKSELYRGQQIEYHAPFDRCNRAEDYRLAWAHFEKILAKA